MTPKLLEYQKRRHIAATAVNQFAMQLYRSIASGPGNLFFSPYSIHSALTLAWNGARERTAAQMAEVLRWPAELLGSALSADAVAEYNSSLKTQHSLVVANALWAQHGHPFHELFVRQLGESFREIDFATQPETARQRINDWVAGKTANRICDLIPPDGVNALTRILLTNAIYFKADWREKFDPADTADAPFHLADGGSVTVPMMRETAQFRAFDEPRFSAVNLQYEGFGLSMQLFVPRQIGDLDWLTETILAWGPNAWQRDMHDREVHLWLPRFRLESSFALAGTVRSMGMTDAFDPIEADFANITPTSGYSLSQVIHRAVVEVDEEGTEAAGATAAILTGGACGPNKPMVIRFDRPFICAICCNSPYCPEPTVVFMGRVMCPSLVQAKKDNPVDGGLTGRVTQYLTVNKFNVRLLDGGEVAAAMPDEFLSLAREEHDDGSFMAVDLELGERPAIARIINARWERPSTQGANEGMQ